MLSSKARYGMKATALLAKRYDQHEYVPVEDIVESEHTPAKFLEAILTQLRKRGILLSRRGPSGGYMLARDPKTISIAEVIRTLDGPFAPTPCARTRNPVCCEGCESLKSCRIRPFMREVRDVTAEIWEVRTIQDLADGYAKVERTIHATM